jgi:hypothetical protein
MARSVRKTFTGEHDGTGAGPVANDQEFLKQAQENVRANQEASRQNLLLLQGLEIRHLENERKWIDQQKARDVSEFNRRELAAINQRYDRLVHRMELRNNSFMGKFARVFGGHKRQQQRIERINNERDRVVTERTKQHVRSEAQRQRSLTERDVKVVKDIQDARERHAEARDKQKQTHEQGFVHSMKQEINRLRQGQTQQPKQRM